MTEEEVPVLSPVKNFKEEDWRKKKKDASGLRCKHSACSVCFTHVLSF